MQAMLDRAPQGFPTKFTLCAEVGILALMIKVSLELVRIVPAAIRRAAGDLHQVGKPSLC